MNGSGIAGRLFSITCMITGADNLEATFNFTLTAQDNDTVIDKTNDTFLLHSFVPRISDAGTYACRATVTSTFLDEPIISNTTVTLTLQSKP